MRSDASSNQSYLTLSPLEPTLDRLADALAETGWFSLPSFLNASFTATLRADSERKFEDGLFREARIGRGEAVKMEKRIRSDAIHWFDPSDLSPAQKSLWSILDSMRAGLNERLFLSLHDFEAHYARYAPGASYGKHVDRFATDDARTVSAVLYLNEDWQPGHGGQLALYPTDAPPVLIEPRAGALVCFLSADLEHEVLASNERPRQSIALWFRKQKSPLR